MDSSLIYAKTPVGDEAVRQSTRVVQRNLRMVLLQVDGSLSVEELIAKIGNQRLVEGALKELEEGGFIAVSTDALAARAEKRSPSLAERFSAISQFSTFGPPSAVPPSQPASGFSSFGKPVFPLAASEAAPYGVEGEDEPPAYSAVRISPRKWFLRGLGGLVVLLLALLLLYPYESFRPGIEASLSRLLATPVKVGEVRVELLPRPRLSLTNVLIGETGDSRIASIAIGSPYVLLGKGPYRLQDVEMSGITVTANRLVDLPMFGGRQMANDISVRRVLVHGVTVTLGDLRSPDISGEMLLRADGTAEKAEFHAADGSFRVDATPSEQGVMLNIEGLSWKPAGMPFAFESLQALGLLQKNRLLIQKLDTTFLGGILKGNWLIDWSAGMVMAGEASLARLDCRKVSAAMAPNLRLEGDLSGSLRMRATGDGWQEMLGHIEANLDIDVARGMLIGIDLGEVARRGSGVIVRSGSTRFDTLQAHLDIAKGRVVARGIQLDAGPMLASGRVTLDADGQTDGLLLVEARSSVASRRVPARVSGPLSDMSLTAGN